MSGSNDFSWDDLGAGQGAERRGDRGLGVLPRSPAEALEPARAPEPPRRRQRREPPRRIKGLLRILTGGLTFIMMAMIAVGVGFYIVRYQFDRPGPLPHSSVVVIPKGDGVNAIADRLVREGVLTDRWLFTLGVLRFRAQRKLKAGEYEFPRLASVRQVLDTLVEGRAILHKVSVPEGTTSYQVVELLNGEPLLKGSISDVPAEGTLLPDTYRFSRGTDRQELLDRMAAEQTKFLETLWTKRAEDLPVKTVKEALILASIVEKETGRADERDRIAGVFTNRLRRGMRLQSDPTIIYGITLGKGSLGRSIRRSEINRPTEYNTYQVSGLPPTPICNPGRAAIEAVLRPAETDDLFFVADGSGGHAFAASLNEHQKNVRLWRKVEREFHARREESAKEAASQALVLTTEDLAAAGLVDAKAAELLDTSFPLPVRKPLRKRN